MAQQLFEDLIGASQTVRVTKPNFRGFARQPLGIRAPAVFRIPESSGHGSAPVSTVQPSAPSTGVRSCALQ